MAQILSLVLQIGVALVVVLFIFFTTIWVMDSDQVFINSKFNQAKKLKVHILNGYVSAFEYNRRQFNTVYQEHPMFLPIRRSVNRMGGAQFTYYFWVYVERTYALTSQKSGTFRKYSLFVKGDPKRYTIQSIGAEKVNEERYVVCPEVTFGDEENDMHIFFNTTKKLREKVSIKSDAAEDSVMRHNVTSLQPKKWVMYTVVFNDNMPLNDFENGLIVKCYVNDILYLTEKLPNVSVKQNNGDFCLLPDGAPHADAGLKISDLTYCNYALHDAEVANTFRKGPNLNMHVDAKSYTEEVLDLSAYNKLDIYNT